MPVVCSEDMEKVYTMLICAKEAHGPRTSIGSDIIAEGCSPDVDMRALNFRILVLMTMANAFSNLPDNPFAPWQNGLRLHPAVFRVAAKAPLKWFRRYSGPACPFEVPLDDFVDQVKAESEEMGKQSPP